MWQVSGVRMRVSRSLENVCINVAAENHRIFHGPVVPRMRAFDGSFLQNKLVSAAYLHDFFI